MLKEAGIDFDALKVWGINPLVLADNLLASGLVLNDDIKWITYHGAFDFAYLLKVLTNCQLPGTMNEFESGIKVFFPQMLDAKIIAASLESVRGSSLQKLGNNLGVFPSPF